MIKLYLSENLSEKKTIKEVYKRLSKSISSEKELTHIIYTYKGTRKKFDSVESIEEFLLAKDFYEYKFENQTEFFREFINLDPRVKILNVLNNSSHSENVQAFCGKYKKSDYQQQYKKLERYNNITIGQFKKESKDEEISQWGHISNVFDYSKLDDKGRHNILNEMDVPICPYCNMNYTISYLKDGVEKNTADIDHFYIKSRFPEYSLCLYNFIPACPVCNQKMKGIHSMTRETHVYPHQEGFDDKKCYFHINNLIEFLSGKQDHVEIKLTNEVGQTRLINSISDFKLNERYEGFHGIAENIVEKVQIYNQEYIKSLETSLNDLFYMNNIKNLAFGQRLTEKQYGRESLGKFKQDLLCQLGIFNK